MEAIKINFTQAGHYWLNDRERQTSVDLGWCGNEKELTTAVKECVDAGSGAEDWTGWTADRS